MTFTRDLSDTRGGYYKVGDEITQWSRRSVHATSLACI
jgi:hypothetical protein